jgi:CubicO group peptidase (beta-lactamase class C family)
MSTHAASFRLHGFLLATLALVLAGPARAGEPTPVPGLDDLVARVLEELRVPGLSVGIVKDREVVLARGYGVRRVGDPAPVDGETRFGIASNTKAFTCTALSILVDEGKLAWDDPVTRHLPELQMYDPWVAREITVRDLVTHRAGLGLGQGDLMWWPATDFTSAEIVRAVRHLKPASSFRSAYAYNNVMYIVAGELAARVSGTSWRELVQSRILDPLGMERTATAASAPAPDGNVATPHVLAGGEARPIRLMSFANAAGAVGINSSASEMALWMRMLLECAGEGEVPEGRTCILKPEAIQNMWSPQTIMPKPKLPGALAPLTPRFAAYGLGFRVLEYRGRTIVTHTGGLPGYVSRVTLVPGERLGIVVLTNQESGAAFEAVTEAVLDAHLGAAGPEVDWLEAFREAAAARQAKAEAQVARDLAARQAGTRPSLPLAGYAGVYRDAWYGEARVSGGGDGLVLDLTRTPGMLADLEHWHHDTFVARWRETWMSDDSPCDAYVTFVLGPDGKVRQMGLEPVSSAIDFSFDFGDLSFEPIRAVAEATGIP